MKRISTRFSRSTHADILETLDKCMTTHMEMSRLQVFCLSLKASFALLFTALKNYQLLSAQDFTNTSLNCIVLAVHAFLLNQNKKNVTRKMTTERKKTTIGKLLCLTT